MSSVSLRTALALGLFAAAVAQDDTEKETVLGVGFTRRAIAPRTAPIHHRSGVVKSAYQGAYDVTNYGAMGDNATDNTASFQAAMAACNANCAASAGSCGGDVYVPPGLYRFTGNFSVPSGCTLQGSFLSVPSHDLRGAGSDGSYCDDGTFLIPTQGRGEACGLDCTSAFISLRTNSAVKGLVIWHDEQESVALPVAYPWALFMQGDNIEVSDVELLGAWNGIAAVAAHRHLIVRVEGQPINIGVFVDETYDIGRIEDVHFNPWFSDHSPFVWWQTTYGRAFVFGRSDWEYVLNTFAFGYGIGYHFIERARGAMNGNFVGIGADMITNASVAVDQSQPYGILISNGEFTAFCKGMYCPPQEWRAAQGLASVDPTHLVVGAENQGTVSFSTSAFWGSAAQIAKLAGTGTTSFSQCHFDTWDTESRGVAALQQRGGKLIVSACEWHQSAARMGAQNQALVAPHVEIFNHSIKTIVTSNVVNGDIVIRNHGNGTTAIANNL